MTSVTWTQSASQSANVSWPRICQTKFDTPSNERLMFVRAAQFYQMRMYSLFLYFYPWKGGGDEPQKKAPPSPSAPPSSPRGSRISASRTGAPKNLGITAKRAHISQDLPADPWDIPHSPSPASQSQPNRTVPNQDTRTTRIHSVAGSAVFFLAMHLGSIYVWVRLHRDISPAFKEGRAGISLPLTHAQW